RWVDVIVLRTYAHDTITEMAANARVPVINALSDFEHPCQALSDIYTVREILGRVKGVRIAFVGDIATNTANSLMSIGAKSGANMVLVGPKDCKPNKTFIGIAKKYSSVFVYNDMKRGLRGCDVVYTDTFVSMGEEAEAAQRRKRFAPYQLNSKTVGYAKKGAKIMHCLPAHRGEEITSQVMDGKDSIILQQSANKLLLEKAILLYLLKK
ncbi:MAG: ornithine carbamoyltransferase, partial [Candidatus Micrarchaeota archaeon]|nr:ornithine carbamoyltransferase [Candidatus Micrarchaeota archaeon]